METLFTLCRNGLTEMVIKGASKDPIDCLRYLAVMEPIFVSDSTFKASVVQGY